jgi:hypothetical protein
MHAQRHLAGGCGEGVAGDGISHNTRDSSGEGREKYVSSREHQNYYIALAGERARVAARFEALKDQEYTRQPVLRGLRQKDFELLNVARYVADGSTPVCLSAFPFFLAAEHYFFMYFFRSFVPTSAP